MSKLDSEILLHKAKLDRVCQGLLAGNDYLVLGPLGIGKSTFLRNIEPYWRNMAITHKKEFQFQYEDFSRQSVLPEDEVRDFKEKVLTDLRSYTHDEECVTIYLMDHIEEAITRAEVYDLSFFEAVAIYKDRSSLSCVVASSESLWDQLREMYTDSGQRKRYKRPILDTISLGLVPTEEADIFIVEAGGRQSWKKEMPWLCEHTRNIRDIAGCYPLFLQRAIEELHSLFGKDRVFDTEEFHREFLERMSDRYQALWESLDEKERGLLFRLARGDAPSEGEQTVLEALRSKALITDDHRVFSTAFQNFVTEYTEYAPVPWQQKLWSTLWPPRWDRAKTLYAMLILMSLYAVALPVTRVASDNPGPIIGMFLIIFMAFFLILMVLYTSRKR